MDMGFKNLFFLVRLDPAWTFWGIKSPYLSLHQNAAYSVLLSTMDVYNEKEKKNILENITHMSNYITDHNALI